MTINFATARSSYLSTVARCLTRRRPPHPANDNGEHVDDSALLNAALRHFGEHGLGAARAARQRAEEAFFTGDREAYDWWLAVCRILDRRMAEQLSQKTK